MKPERIQGRLAQLPDWQLVASPSAVIEWQQKFSSFNRVVEVLVEIALLVERFGRVPEVSVQGNVLTLRLGTGGLEEADFDLAEAISKSC